MYGDRLIRVAQRALVIVFVMASATVLSAQTVVNPRYVEFTPSSDHNTVANGAPLVERYSLSIFAAGSSTAFDVIDLGKPAPTGGVIRVDFLPLLHSAPTPGVLFEARVSAVGPGGANGSNLSNTFSFQGTCTPSIGATGQSVGSGVTAGSVGVTAGAGCTWTATSNASWITLTGATSGNGNGTVPYSVAANTATSARSGTLTIAGRTYTVSQAAAPCAFSISPSTQSVAAAGANGSTTVTTTAGCAWTAVSNAAWISVTAGASASGSGSASFAVAPSTVASQRTGTLTIAGRTFTVTQAANACSYTLTPTSRTLTAAGGTGSITVGTASGCAWTASTTQSWITVSGSGTSSGSASYTVAQHTGGSARTGTISLGTRVFTITQSGATGAVPPIPPASLRIVVVSR